MKSEIVIHIIISSDDDFINLAKFEVYNKLKCEIKKYAVCFLHLLQKLKLSKCCGSRGIAITPKVGVFEIVGSFLITC